MQDQAIVEIGKIELKRLGNLKPYQLFIQNMFPEKETYDVLLVVFKIVNKEGQNHIEFTAVDIEKASPVNFLKYGYRKGSARGGDITFTTKAGDIDKKFQTFYEIQLKKACKSTLDDGPYFQLLYNWLADDINFSTVKDALATIYLSLGKSEQMAAGLSFVFLIEGKKYYTSDLETIQQWLISSGTEEKSLKYGSTSEGKNVLCSICFEKKNVLHGFGSPYKYATVDKPGMVSGFFRQANNWKNYPICTECSLQFELGKTFISTKLNKYFYGYSYYAIPKVFLRKDAIALGKVLSLLEDLYNEEQSKERGKKDEDRIWKLIGEQEDYFNLDLLFYEENATTKAIKIKLHIEEILPSRFRKLFLLVPQELNQLALFKDVLTEKQGGPHLIFQFGLLKYFFGEDFYDCMQNIFLLRPINPEVLYQNFMRVLRENFNKSQTAEGFVNLKQDVIKALMVLYYFQKLNLISFNKNFTPMEENSVETTPSKKAFDLLKLQDFVRANPGFLDTEYKIGLFSVGILVRLLLNIQQAELSSTPFLNKLKGYNLNPEAIKTIYLEALNKLNQYTSFYAHKDLKEYINLHFNPSVYQLSKLSNNEVSFYFISGVEMGGMFKNETLNKD
jgi:CRISPR-associated protein Csh1